MSNEETILFVEKQIGYCFKDKNLILEALTHKSYSNEMKVNKRPDYERYEFLGDAVLELISSEFLFKKFPLSPEGGLSKKRASMVCEPSLALCARRMELGNAIFMGRGEEKTGGRDRDAILCDIIESVLGAIYIDGGIDAAVQYVYSHILNYLKDSDLFVDSKSMLMETVTKDYPEKQLIFKLMDTFGPDHEKTFVVQAFLDDEPLAVGQANSKKNAEQMAARLTLEILENRK